ncbi:superoxide dismutase family protein [Bowmanella dokdonensis]|uniref:Superoxide dismutase [Cu-Zn] n=1 Tax=Bowmanella dokdonensis TaxID=751969 RepID=A0A939DQM4_9ALTE|nr:superoxide dismutase family protein [Bowmanella dokdonensis]MBN7826883.1 superoxide dismutase family protein [Bowmanella dokdonensis]
MKKLLSVALTCCFSSQLLAHAAVVEMKDVKSGKSLGTIEITYTEYGTVFTPNLVGLTPGLHGFHVHQNPDCGDKMKDGEKVPGGAAGSHYDPEDTGHHGYPWTADNHRGDLPALYVSKDGVASHPVLAPRLSLTELDEQSLMIHQGGDNYADEPEPLGGGGPRVACGVIKHS